MVDIPGNNTTTRTILVGGASSDTLEFVGDHDWFKIQLTAGQSISVFLDGITLEDPYLRIRDVNGNVIYENDDITSGVNRDSLLAFTAGYTGTYYIDVGAWDENYTGTYQLSVSPYTPPPVATVQDIANQLVYGHWGGDDHHFNVTQGGTLTVNITALTSAGQTLARAALATWTDIIGVHFVEVATGGRITFDDNESGAFSDGNWSGGIISSTHVNVSTQWLAQYGTSLNGYAFQTYIHEIGHALGLGHAGNYNGEARYPFDALFSNDSWPMSVMSYFSQQENSYFAGLGFNENFIITPMMADILAMSMLYGLSTTTRVGDTVYGPTWTGNMGALCLFDSGGIDTIDCSTLSGQHRIDLNPGTFSNIMGEVGNVSIALGVTIENASGGAGSDTLIGNQVNNVLGGGGGNDILNGGAGADTLTGGSGSNTLTGGSGGDAFLDTAANLSGDTITDFGAGDRIVISNASLAGFSFSLSGNTLTYTGGSLALTGFSGQLQASAAAEGGVQLTMMAGAPAIVARNDFNGDGRDDLLLRHDNGTVTDWLGQANGGFFSNHAIATYGLDTSWQVAGTGDFNGDGRDDVLLRHANGTITDWLGQANGGFFSNHAIATFGLDTSWQVAGTGDFNGDGRDDVLLRHTNGTIADWLGQANGGFLSNHATATYGLDTSWQVAGTGDFNGDGRDDVLLRHDNGTISEWLGQADGGFFSNHAIATYGLETSWHVAGTGDFNGDGRDDVLLRHTNGTITDWLGQANGGFFSNNVAASYGLDNAWHVQSDFLI